MCHKNLLNRDLGRPRRRFTLRNDFPSRIEAQRSPKLRCTFSTRPLLVVTYLPGLRRPAPDDAGRRGRRPPDLPKFLIAIFAVLYYIKLLIQISDGLVAVY